MSKPTLTIGTGATEEQQPKPQQQSTGSKPVLTLPGQQPTSKPQTTVLPEQTATVETEKGRESNAMFNWDDFLYPGKKARVRRDARRQSEAEPNAKVDTYADALIQAGAVQPKKTGIGWLDNLMRTDTPIEETDQRVRARHAAKKLVEAEDAQAAMDKERETAKASGLGSEDWYAQSQKDVDALNEQYRQVNRQLQAERAKAQEGIFAGEFAYMFEDQRAAAEAKAKELEAQSKALEKQIEAANARLNYAGAMRWDDAMESEGFEAAAEKGKADSRNKVRRAEKELSNEFYNPEKSEVDPDELRAAEFMSDSEKQIYDWLLASRGEEAADQYLAELSDTLNIRQGRQIAGEIEDMGPGGRAVNTVALAGATGVGNALKGLTQNLRSDAAPTSATDYAGQYVRQDLEDAGPKIFDRSLAGLGYDAINTIGNMAPSLAVGSLNPVAGAATMALSSKGNAYKRALDEGYTKGQAQVYSSVIGAAEGGLQYLLGGLSKLGGIGQFTEAFTKNIGNAGLRAAAEIGIDLFGENLEETLQNKLDLYMRNTVFGENNEIKLWDEDDTYTVMLTTLTTLLMNAGQTHNTVQVGKVGRAFYQSRDVDVLLDLAAKSGNADVRAMADDIISGKTKATENSIGELAISYAQAGGDLSAIAANHATVDEAATEAARESAQNAAESPTSEGDIPAPPATQNAATGESGRLNRGAITEGTAAVGTPQTEAAQTAPKQTAMQPTAAAEITPVEQSGGDGTVPAPAVQENDGGMIPPTSQTEPGGPVVPQGAKLSKFWTNTLSKAEAAAGTPQEVSQPLWYLPKTEQQSLAEAASMLSSDEQGTVEKLVDAEAWSGTQTDAAYMVLNKLFGEAKSTGNWDAYKAWRQVMRQHETAGGQGIQANAKYSRRNAEGVMQEATDMLLNSSLSPEEQTSALAEMALHAEAMGDVEDASAESLRELIKIQAEERNNWTIFRGNMDRFLADADIEWLRDAAYQQTLAFARDAMNKGTANMANKVASYQVMSMLAGVPTIGGNLLGNSSFGNILDLFAARTSGRIIDTIVSKTTKSNMRTVVGPRTNDVAAAKEWLGSAWEAMKLNLLESALDIDLGGSRPYGMPANSAFSASSGPVSKFFQRGSQIMSYALTATDRFFRGGIESGERANYEAFNKKQAEKGKTGTGLSEDVEATLAERTADYRLFQNKTELSEGLKKLRRTLNNMVGVGGKRVWSDEKGRKVRIEDNTLGLGTLVAPFVEVPVNLALKAAEYNPANLVKGLVEWGQLAVAVHNGDATAIQQQAASMDIARGITGTGLLVLATALAKAGLIRNGDDEDDYDVSAINRASGMQGTQWNISATLRNIQNGSTDWQPGDIVIGMSRLQPFDVFLNAGTKFAKLDDTALPADYANTYLQATVSSLLDMPLFSDMARFSQTLKDADEISLETLGDLAGTAVDNTASRFVPQFIRQAAKAADPYERDTGSDSWGRERLNNVLSLIPGLRNTLDAKVDSYGNEKEQPESLERWMNGLVLATPISKLRISEMSQELYDVRNATGIDSFFPDRKAPKSEDLGNGKFELSHSESRLWQESYGSAYTDAVNALTESDDWGQLSDDGKAAALKSAESYARYVARKALAEERGEEYSNDAWDKISEFEDPNKYISARSEISTAVKEKDFDLIESLLEGGKAFDSLPDVEKESMFSSIKELKRLVSMRGDGVSAENAMKAIDAIKGLKTQDEQTAAIVGLDDMSDADKIKVLKSCTSEDYAEKVKTAYDSGVSLEEWSRVYAAQQRIKNGEGSAQTKANDFALWLDKNTKLTAAQKDVVQEQLSFYSMNKAEPTHYDGLRESKVNEDTARRIANAMTKIQPLEGKTQATQEQKVDTILGMGLSVGDTWAALKEYTSEAWYNKAAEAYRRGIDLDDYVRQFREADLPNDKGETNGQLSQDELWKYYKANPNNETFVKVMWLIAGFKTDWDTYKRKHR